MTEEADVPCNDKGGLVLLAMTEETDVPCNDEKGPLRAKGRVIPNKRNVIASQRRGNPGGGDVFRASPNLRWGIPLYFEVLPIYLN